jgi:methionyl-tRNA formyltransferase
VALADLAPSAARRLRLAFMGSAAFSLPTLKALHEAGHDIACVYSQPPKPAGRGHKLQPSVVHAYALQHGLPVHTPVRLRGAEEHERFRALDLDAAVVAAYGLILPPAILEAPRLGCLNVHGSLLPRWRGAAPVQRAILAGDAETGVTIMQMDAGLDTGPMLLREAVPISEETDAAGLTAQLAVIGAALMLRALDGLAAGTLTSVAQPEDGVTYAHKLQRDEGRLDWRRPAVELARMVRALNPWPGVWFERAGERLRVLQAQAVAGSDAAAPGTVLRSPDDATGLAVACGDGALRLLRLQRPGKAALPAADVLRGYPLPPGTVLS